MVDQRNLDELRSVEELANYKTSVDADLNELDAEADGRPFNDEQRDKFADLSETSHQIEKRIQEL